MVGLDNPIHLLFLLVIVLLIFGAKRLPEMGRSLGSGLRGFKESISGEVPHEHHPELSAMSAAQVTPEPTQPIGDVLPRADARPAA